MKPHSAGWRRTRSLWRARKASRRTPAPWRRGWRAPMSERRATIDRRTAETQIRLVLDLDGSGKAEVRTGVPFLDHMLTLTARHGLLDLEIEATGDLAVDLHHTVEDTGICLGEAILKAAGDK